MAPYISVIVATYERADALDAVLRGLSKQTDRHFEILVADDGSGPQTADTVHEWQDRLSIRMRHIWHPDRGFRLAEIRNRSVAASKGEYLVFLDGDCIPCPDFVARHRDLAEPGWTVCGHRILLSEAFTRTVLDIGLPIEDWDLRRWLIEFRKGSINRFVPLMRVPGNAWRRLSIRSRAGKARGCNLGMWRDDFYATDGFDARFIGWGHEDYDLAVRLQTWGIKFKDARWATGVFHLWHPLADRGAEAARLEEIKAARTTNRLLALRGLSHLACDERYSNNPSPAAGCRRRQSRSL